MRDNKHTSAAACCCRIPIRQVLLMSAGLLILLADAASLLADDWPQFLGPRRDGTSLEERLRDNWTKDGPPVVWQANVGEGFSAPVVTGDRLIVFHRKGAKEIVACLNARTGANLWETTNPTTYQDMLGKGDGPRSTPTVANGRIVTLGAQGWLQCLNLEDGKRLWGKSLLQPYQVPSSYFGVGTSPLVVEKHILINVGGKKGGIVAFDINNGNELWKATTDGASYSSPALAEVNGKQRAVFLTRYGVVILNPKNGQVDYRQKWRARYDASVNAATPLVIGKHLFFSSSYETGALLLQAAGGQYKEVWKSDNVMSNHYNTCLYHQGHLYGIDGRQEYRPRLRCIELQTGKVKWTRENFGCAAMILAQGRIIALTEGGDLVLIKAAPTAYMELARAHVLDNTPCRAYIALANGFLYGRDESRLVCWNLKK